MSALIVFIQKAIAQGIGMLFGATGEIITEKSGNLNLGVPGLMYMGDIAVHLDFTFPIRCNSLYCSEKIIQSFTTVGA